jgi:type IV secretory pathway component VirB8
MGEVEGGGRYHAAVSSKGARALETFVVVAVFAGATTIAVALMITLVLMLPVATAVPPSIFMLMAVML